MVVIGWGSRAYPNIGLDGWGVGASTTLYTSSAGGINSFINACLLVLAYDKDVNASYCPDI
jgi:hypothetical protein